MALIRSKGALELCFMELDMKKWNR